MRREGVELIASGARFPFDVLPAARASLWLRDAAGMRRGAGRARRLAMAARRICGLRCSGPAWPRWRGGRTRPGPGYLVAEAGLRDLGIRFELGLAALEHAVFLPDDPSAAAAADEARAIFAELGATTLLARLPARERVAG